MRFLADENVSAKLFPFLRSAGHDVRAIVKGTADPEVAAQAKAEGRLILTHDTDFANSDRHPPATHAGIILIRINPLYVDSIKGALTRLFTSVPEATLRGRRFLVFEETFVELEEGEAVPFAASE